MPALDVTIDGLYRLPLAEFLAPAIAYAQNGFPVSQLVALYWKGNMIAFDRAGAMIEESDNRRHTYLINGKTPVEGEVFRNPDLARRLLAVADRSRRFNDYLLRHGRLWPEKH